MAILVEDPMGTDRDPRYRVVSQHDPLEATMSSNEHTSEERSAVRNDLSAIFVSLELSRSTWLVTSLSPGAGCTALTKSASYKAGHMDASDLIKALQNILQGRGRPHMGNAGLVL